METINSIIGKTNDKTSIPQTFTLNGKKTNCKEIVDNLWSYFTNIRPTYANEILKPTKIPVTIYIIADQEIHTVFYETHRSQ